MKKKIAGHTQLFTFFSVIFFIFYFSNISAYTWKPVAINGGGYVPGIVYSRAAQNLIYLRTDVGGFYRWDNINSTWIPLNDMFGPSQSGSTGGESIAADPVNPNIVYAAAGFSGYGVILSSTNQGNSWNTNPIPVTIAGNNDGREAGERLAIDPNLTSKLYFGSRRQGLWVSTNSALSWSQVISFPVTGDLDYGLAWVIFDPTGTSGIASQNIYVGVMSMSSANCNIYRSTNGGTSWAIIPNGPTNMITPRASLGTDGNLWIVYDSGGYGPGSIANGQIWKLNTSTLGWTNVTPSNGPGIGAGGYGGISVDAQNAQHAVVCTMDWWSGNDKVLGTTNGGTSWNWIASSSTGWNSPPFSMYTNNGALWTRGCGSTDSGTMGWPSGIQIDPFNSASAIYGSGGGIWWSNNITAATQPQGITWNFKDNGIEETVPIYMNPSAAGGILFSAMGDVGGMRHTNLDISPPSGAYCNPSFTNTNMLDFAQSNPNIVVRVGNSGTLTSDVAYSNDNGQTWSPWGSAPPGYTTINNMDSVAVSADGSHVVVSPSSTHGTPAYATSLGGTWTSCTGLPSGACVVSDRVTANTFYATSPMRWVYGGNVIVYRSTDFGVSFTQVNSIPVNYTTNGNGSIVIPRPVFDQAGEFWLSTDDALHRFTNGGTTVTTIPNVFPLGPVGFGKAAPGYTHPAVYLSGYVNGVYGIYRCDDGIGTAWTQINDVNHQFGSPGWVQGDENIYGRIYIAPGARGIIYCDSASASTATNTPTIVLSPTLTCTRTRTSTYTPVNTVTQSVTQSVTPVITFTFTSTPITSYTNTQTITLTRTPSNTQTLTITRTSSSTVTNTCTFTHTVTLSITSTNTTVFSPTQTFSATPYETNTPGATKTFTLISTSTATPVNTPVNSATQTSVNTATKTFVNTFTKTPTNSATNTPTNTASNTPINTFTKTPVNTATLTRTVTQSITSTLTITATVIIPTVSFTPTVAPSASVYDIKNVLVYPLPYFTSTGGLLKINFTVSMDTKLIKVSIYTPAFRLIRMINDTQFRAAGSNTLLIDSKYIKGLASGSYYYSISAVSVDNQKSKAKAGVVILIK